MCWFHILVGQPKESYLRFGTCWCTMWKAVGCSKEAENCSWLAGKSTGCELQWVWPIGSSFRFVGIQDLSFQSQEGKGTCSDVRTEFMVTTASVVKHWLEFSRVSSQGFCVWQMLQRLQHQFHVLGYPAGQTLNQLSTVLVQCTRFSVQLQVDMVDTWYYYHSNRVSTVDCWKFLLSQDMTKRCCMRRTKRFITLHHALPTIKLCQRGWICKMYK